MAELSKIEQHFSSETLSGRLGKIEFFAMNNPLRRWVQRNIELKVFSRFLKNQNINLTNKTILDAGCGSGYSTEIIIKTFKPSKIIAFDLMPEQIEHAKKRKTDAIFYIGDINEIKYQDNTFDAIFVFGVIHHVNSWKRALRELSRVLKSGGALLIEEPLGMFNWKEFEDELISIGYKIPERAKLLGNYFKSYLCILK